MLYDSCAEKCCDAITKQYGILYFLVVYLYIVVIMHHAGIYELYGGFGNGNDIMGYIDCFNLFFRFVL